MLPSVISYVHCTHSTICTGKLYLQNLTPNHRIAQFSIIPSCSLPPDGVQILLRPGVALRATLPQQGHEREEVRKRVKGRAVVHRVRSRGRATIDAGGGPGGR